MVGFLCIVFSMGEFCGVVISPHLLHLYIVTNIGYHVEISRYNVETRESG